jgi:hypothetical protein
MVVSPVRPTNGTVEITQGPVKAVATDSRMVCPRCNAQLRINYDEPECLQCGYVNYRYPIVNSNGAKKNVVSAGTLYVLRYMGSFPSLRDTLLRIRLQRLRNRITYAVQCPFCAKEMVQSSLSGKRREAREERYKCPEGHRVSLTPTRDGTLGWK